ncbi:DUF4197 domain-containing protein [Alkalitalea saponilacus]|uniref:DUF4197 domain-containing protein n=1 Tax=Alkalitalea saponilacus TaxID=889453 RepID=A0A1T5HB75_9BACT|nr:DUF4197 domain-containing protein [Alkalitalea saponilacus]ASB50778.1 hypothetical protein CDL62_17275 [Alkalitalea saponilacus]SKC17928.1 Protein of unknown function [Alkalitalea saponilacus]
MNKLFKYIALSIFITAGCAELTQIVQTIEGDRPLTQTEVANGLREALKIGTDSAASGLSRMNGYYGDELVKILLPPEAAVITDNLNRIPGGEKLLEDVILRINRSAEHAAKEATPIFVNAVTKMTIQDAFTVLRDGDNAATQYLRNHTYNELFKLYQPKIESSLNQNLVTGISTNDSWQNLTGQWNRLAGSLAGQIAGFNTVEIELDEYLTHQALDGLFLKLAEEEAKIRTNPAARVTALLERVFGSSEAQR